MSRSGARSVSTAQRLVSMGMRSIVASRMTPVSPMPPIVAQNNSASCSGDSSTTSPSARSSDIRWTWLPNEPSRWWFLPWMSLASAPPTVTNRVPGDTGTNHPRGTISRSRSSIPSPAGTMAVPAAVSITTSWGDASRRRATPPPFCAESPYERPSPRGMPPRGGSALTAALSASRSPAAAVTTSVDDGLVRPHPVRRVRPPALTMATVPCGSLARMLRPPGRGRIRATHERGGNE